MFAAVAVAVVAQSDPICGKACFNNANCGGSRPSGSPVQCTRCNSSTSMCSPGFGCGEMCTVNTDCDQSGFCTLCTDGVCQSSRECNAYCDDNIHCIGTCLSCESNKCKGGCSSPCFARSGPNTTSPSVCGAACPLCLVTGGCGSAFCCTASYCNTLCEADSECGGTCPMCSAALGRCTSKGCGALCAGNADCARYGGQCSSCFAGHCTSNCGGACTTAADCGADCSTCTNQRCVPGQCGVKCLTNAGCDASTGCGYCRSTGGTGGVCSKGKACGATCGNDLDCDQSGACKICTGGICQSDQQCRSYCNSAIKCIGACQACEANVCRAGCNAACDVSSINPNATNVCSRQCPLCLPTGTCGSGLCCTSTFCVAQCKSASDCGGDCPTCNPTLGRCVGFGCGATCTADGDCKTYGGNCTTCLAGKCTSQCGGACSSAKDCGADCSSCTGGKCVPGACGAACATNAGCQPTKCSHCAGGSCVQGAACGATCSNDLDCDQTGSCKSCPLAPGMSTGVCTSTA